MAMVSAREWREIPGRYNLIGSKCENCGKIFFPSRSFCPDCRRAGMGKMVPFNMSRKGEVYSFSINHDASGFNNRMMPYAVAMIKNDDGVLIAGQLVDVEFDKIQIGMRVKAVMRKLNEDGEAGVIHYGFKFVPDE
ncbi:MAG: Zn-ribbon domain-containing OB-fold protein [archaeon]|nr:Zn-ribbon domain-containing OB-fold protein [archaeon]